MLHSISVHHCIDGKGTANPIIPFLHELYVPDVAANCPTPHLFIVSKDVLIAHTVDCNSV